MKLTYDGKVQIYELRKQRYSLEKLSNKFGINNSNIRYMIKLIFINILGVIVHYSSFNKLHFCEDEVIQYIK